MIIKLNLNGSVIEGGKPSKETGMHLEIYRARPEISGIIHPHPPFSVAFSCVAQPLDGDFVVMPAFTPGFVVRIGKIGFVKYLKPGSVGLANAVKEVINKCKVLILQNHGIVTIGKNLDEALVLAEEMEGNAQLYFLTSGHSPRSLSPENVEELVGKII
jgi:ribulose-5-phosphate 4-epimerase/fuculose-1-phosphate aldolase